MRATEVRSIPVAGAILVVAGSPSAQRGPEAALVSTAGWARAAQRVLGDAWIATPRGLIDPTEARRRGSAPVSAPTALPGLRRHVPTVAKTAVTDLRSWRGARRYAVDPAGPWNGTEITFVWQRHEIFQDAGLRLADQLGVPTVLFVPAPIIWEADQWGTRRPGWGRFMERRGERPALLRATVVACGTDAVAEQVVRLGVDSAKVMITPTGVDLDLFAPNDDRRSAREDLGLQGRFVVGWMGSFRRFHAVERAVDAVAGLGDRATLLLVGDGPERSRMEALSRDRQVHTVSTGTVAHAQLAPFVSAMDVGLVLAPVSGGFHYSPLKLAEYLACGVAVVAPAIGAIPERLTDGHDALLVPPHDAPALRDALVRLRDDPALRHDIASAGRASAEASWSWDHQVRRIAQALT